MKTRWLVITLLVGVLAIGINGGPVLAQDGGVGVGGDSPPGKFAAKVATILGLDESQVQAAFKQAAGEMRNEALQRKLARMVEHGRLTQEQADAYMKWYLARPQGVFPGLQLPGLRGHGFHRGGMMGGDSPPGKFAAKVATILGLDEAQVQAAFKQAAREMQDEALQKKLARMVEHGRLTQEQADAYMEWYRARPEGLLPGFQHHGLRGHGFHRGGMMGGHGGHGMGFWQQMPPLPAPESSEPTSL